MLTSDPDLWTRWRGRELHQRLGPAPAELLAHVAGVNQSEGWTAETHSGAAPPDFVDDLRTAIAGLPVDVLSGLQERLLGVFWMTGLGCSAVSDVVLFDGSVLGYAIVVDAELMARRRANAWATWKETLPFAGSEAGRLAVTIEPPDGDRRSNALQFILLHEIGHVLAGGSSLLPDWWVSRDRLEPAAAYSFLDLSWQIDAAKCIQPRPAFDFPQRAKLAYYRDAPLDAADALPAYRGLAKSNFPTLYGATHPYDDFAECFALYVHTELLHKPYRVEMSDHGVRLLACGAGVAGRCADKYLQVRALLASHRPIESRVSERP